MKTYLRYTLLCLFALSSALCGAKVTCVPQNFQSLSTSKKIKFNSPTNTIGTTDFVTYTCSGDARFSADETKTDWKVAIFLEQSGAQVTTTQIQNLDSLWISYVPNANKAITVKISTDSVSWEDVEAVHKINGAKHVKMPRVGDYYVRIIRSDNVYITQIDFTCLDLSGCPNCFLYKPE